MLVLTAEAGIGKTRFAAEVGAVRRRLRRRRRRGTPRTPARGCCRCAAPRSASAAGSRRWPTWSAAAIGLPSDADHRGDPAGGRGAAAPARPSGSRRAGAEPPPIAVDQLLALLGYAELPGDRGADRPGRVGRRRPPAADAEAVPIAVADLLSALAAEAPLVVIVDDLHDATAETIDALGATLSRLTGPVLVLLLGRPELVRTAGALTRLADAEVHTAAAAARRGRRPAAHRVPRRRQAAAGRRPTGCSPPPRATRSTWPSWSPC